MHWEAVGDELTDEWQSKNCKPGFKSNEERRLLAEISSTRVSMNEYASIASDYIVFLASAVKSPILNHMQNSRLSENFLQKQSLFAVRLFIPLAEASWEIRFYRHTKT